MCGVRRSTFNHTLMPSYMGRMCPMASAVAGLASSVVAHGTGGATTGGKPPWPAAPVGAVPGSVCGLQLPSTLTALNLHDVFHFSALKRYCEAFAEQCTTDTLPEPPTAASFEVDCIKDFDRSHARTDQLSIQAPHFLIAWRGYDSSHVLWLPVDELAQLLEAVPDFLSTNTAPKQRERIIAQFPREQRLQLAHLVSRAFKSRRPVRDSVTSEAAPVFSTPPQDPRRRHKRTAASKKQAPWQTCVHFARVTCQFLQHVNECVMLPLLLFRQGDAWKRTVYR